MWLPLKVLVLQISILHGIHFHQQIALQRLFVALQCFCWLHCNLFLLHCILFPGSAFYQAEVIINPPYFLHCNLFLLQCKLLGLGNIFVALQCLFLAVQFCASRITICICCATIFSFLAPQVPRFVTRQTFFVFLSWPMGVGTRWGNMGVTGPERF